MLLSRLSRPDPASSIGAAFFTGLRLFFKSGFVTEDGLAEVVDDADGEPAFSPLALALGDAAVGLAATWLIEREPERRRVRSAPFMGGGTPDPALEPGLEKEELSLLDMGRAAGSASGSLMGTTVPSSSLRIDPFNPLVKIRLLAEPLTGDPGFRGE